MKVIVDANIVFSAILNTNGMMGDLLLNSKGIIDFVAPKYMLSEITKYHNKIMLLTGMSQEELNRVQNQITRPIIFIAEEQVPSKYWINAEKIVIDIDPKDTPYIAYSNYFRLKIWTGDKALRKGLIKKGYNKTITTNELYDYREHRKNIKSPRI